MKKTKLTRKLMAACSIVALSAVMYGCAHTGNGDGSTAMDDPPPPPPAAAAVDLMGSTDLMPGMTTIAAGASVTVGNTTLTCSEDADCVVTVMQDDVTGSFTATASGGMVTVAVAMLPPPPPPPTVYTVDLMGSPDLMAGMTTIPAGTSMTVGDTTLTCDGTEDCVLTVAEDSVTGGFSATSTGGTVTVAIAEPPTPPTVHAVNLMDSDELEAGTTTIPAGTSVTAGDRTTITCPAGGEDCVLTVVADAVTGGMTATATGGMATVTYYPLHMVELPEDHGLSVGTTTLQPGESHQEGRTIVTCPAGGDPCKFTVMRNPLTDTDTLTATSIGSMVMFSEDTGFAALEAFGKTTAVATGVRHRTIEDVTIEGDTTTLVGDVAAMELDPAIFVEAGITMSYATHGSGQSLVKVVPEVTNPSTGDDSNKYAGGATAPTGADDDEQAEIDETMEKISVAERVPNYTISTDTTGNAAEEWEVEGDAGDTLSMAVSGGRTLTVDFISDYETDITDDVDFVDDTEDMTAVMITTVDDIKWSRIWFANDFFNNLGEGQERIIPENTGGDQAGYPTPLHGTLDGIPGMFSCGDAVCTIDRHAADGRIQVMGELEFTPYGDAMEHEEFVDDTDWLVAGSWMINPADNETGNFEFGAFAYGGDPFVTDVTDDNSLEKVLGDANYEGTATGRYARGMDGETDQGLFSADVALEANFGNGVAASATNSTLMIEGELSGFTLGDNTTTENWALSLEVNIQDWDRDGNGADGTYDMTNAAGVFGGLLSGTADNHTIEGAWWGRFFGNESPGMVANPAETEAPRMIPADQPGSVAGVFSGTESDGVDYSLTLGGAYMADWESGTHPAAE